MPPSPAMQTAISAVAAPGGGHPKAAQSSSSTSSSADVGVGKTEQSQKRGAAEKAADSTGW